MKNIFVQMQFKFHRLNKSIRIISGIYIQHQFHTIYNPTFRRIHNPWTHLISSGASYRSESFMPNNHNWIGNYALSHGIAFVGVQFSCYCSEKTRFHCADFPRCVQTLWFNWKANIRKNSSISVMCTPYMVTVHKLRGGGSSGLRSTSVPIYGVHIGIYYVCGLYCSNRIIKISDQIFAMGMLLW